MTGANHARCDTVLWNCPPAVRGVVPPSTSQHISAVDEPSVGALRMCPSCRKDEFYYEIDCLRDFGVNVTAVNESRRCKSGPDRSAGSTWCPLSPGIRQMGRRDASNTSVSQTRSKSLNLGLLFGWGKRCPLPLNSTPTLYSTGPHTVQ